jgi:hypothetical protein
MSVDLDIELRSVTRHLKRSHGEVRVLTAGEFMVLLAGSQDILLQLRQGWPVVTGRSRAGWSVEPIQRPFLGYRVSNGIDYSQYVHRSGEGPDPLWQEQMLIIRDRILPPIVERLNRTITETEQYSQPVQQQRQPQRSLFLSTPQQQTIDLFSQVRRLRRLVRRR